MNNIGTYGGSAEDLLCFGSQPIFRSLDGAAAPIVSPSNSTMAMDAGGEGLLHRTAWAAGSGVLFYDPDGTGAITEKRQYVFTEWDQTATGCIAAA